MDRSHAKGHLRHAESLAVVFKLLDSLSIFGVLMLAIAMHQRVTLNSRFVLIGLLVLLAFYLVSESVGLYRSWRGTSLHEEFFQVALAWGITILLTLLLGYLFKRSEEFSRLVAGLWILLTPLAMGGWRLCVRLILRHFRSKGYNIRSVAIVGAGSLGVRVAKTIQYKPCLGLKLLGFFDDRKPKDDRLAWQGDVEGAFDELVTRARGGEIDLIYITLPMTAHPRIMSLTDRLADTTASVYLVPDFFTFNLFHGQWDTLGDLPMVSVFDTPFWGVAGWLKRVQDILLSSLILIAISPVMLAVAAAVKFTSTGPVIFRQRRYGVDGKEIFVWKFRSMRVAEDGDSVVQAKKNDLRVTAVGAFIRRTSLDELPQFFNVLLGDMSIVGPRPHAVVHNEEYRGLIKGYMLRHAVKPGITGWAQVNGWRGETDTLDKMEKRVEHDLWYIRNWSSWLDLKIVFLTLFKGFTGTQAY
ncbi:MAG: undecaprenyl-phosphate glucose phosphotransferase [Gammaproteobacteria bacterium]|nr:undecaprenyl-phosphate glucose phosphotransferase [Gammaproteobacteria bacterium]